MIKKIPSKIIVSLFLITLMVFKVFSQEPDLKNNTNQKIRVGYYESDSFQEGIKAGSTRKGYGYEYYIKLSEYTGWEYEYVYGTFPDLVDKARRGEIDLLSGVTLNQQKEDALLFPDMPMGSTVCYLMKKNSSSDITTDPKSVDGKNIGVSKNFMIEALNSWMVDNKVQANVTYYDSNYEMMKAFDSGVVDIVVVSGRDSVFFKDADLFTSIDKQDYYLCASKCRPDLLKIINTVQLQLASDEPDYLNVLNAQFFPKLISVKAFTESELLWIKNHQQLRIGYLDNYLPYCDTDSKGNVIGFVKDIVPEMLKRLDIDSQISVSYKGYSSTKNMINELKAGNLDIIFPAGGSHYYLELEGIHTTIPAVSSTVGIVYKKDFPKVNDCVFAVNSNNQNQKFFIDNTFPEAKRLYYNSIDECLKAVKKGEADCTTVNGLRLNAILQNSKYRSLNYYLASDLDYRGFGIKLGDEPLLKIINKGIQSIGSQYILNQAYIYTDELINFTVWDFIHEYLLLLLLIAALIIALVITYFIADNRKKRFYLLKETRKNRELERARDAQESQLMEIKNLVQQLEYAKQNTEKVITEMLRFASSEDDADDIIDQLLTYLGVNTKTDRIYIFEQNDEGSFDNTYEWCGKGVVPQIKELQKVPYKGACEFFFNEFKKDGHIIIDDVENCKKINMAYYELLASQNIKTLVAVPIYERGEIIGFLGVDNPRQDDLVRISEFLNLVEFVFSMMIRIRDNTREIQVGATHDQLTGCRNRKALNDYIASDYKEGMSCAVVSFDMNGLKQINDTQGHEAGDNFICRTAQTLTGIFGKDNVYRMGGDEFIIVLLNITEDEFNKLMNLCSLQIGTTASVGHVFVEKSSGPFSEYVKQADFAMYKDKDKFYQDKRKYR